MKQEKTIKYKRAADGIYEIDTYYIGRSNYTCCYLVEDNGEVAIVETNTNYAVPFILGTMEQLGLDKKQVKYVILTHIHLDHAGGAGELMKNLPKAELVVHPRGRKHMIDPEKLIKSVKEVYGEAKYKELYGEIIPIPEERVITADDGDVLRLGGRELEVFDLRGHAKHHFSLLDKKTNSFFSGDNFGIGYPHFTFKTVRLVFPSTSPTQFEPDKAIETYEKIVDLKPSRVLLTHYGAITELENAYAQLKAWIEFSIEIAEQRYNQGYRDKTLNDILCEDIWARFEKEIKGARGSGLTAEEKELLAIDAELNARGIAHYIHKINSRKDK